jgi:hypothetical protein
MKRTLFFILSIMFALQYQAYGDIEIYADGHKYDSMEAYQESKSAPVVKSSADSGQAKMLKVAKKGISDLTRHKLYVMSIENGIVGVFQDFYHTWVVSGHQMAITFKPKTPVSRRISLAQLQDAIAKAVTSTKGPKLLITGPGKLRIMALSAANK